MKNFKYLLTLLPLCLMSCVSTGDKITLASLRNASIEIKEEKIEGSLEKAMESYQKFLQETPESAMTPEALRRLADLKIEKEYGSFSQAPTASKNSCVRSCSRGS